MNLAPARRVIGPVVGRAPGLAVLVLLVLAGWLAARWLLYFAAPEEAPPVPRLERVQLGAAAQALADAHVFGIAPAGPAREMVSNLSIKLRGVFTGGADVPGLAIVNTGARDETARVGGEIVPGVVLEAVHPQHVMVRRNGELERLNLEAPQRAAPLVAPVRNPGTRFPRRDPPGPAGDAGTQSTPVVAPVPPRAPVSASGAADAPGAPGTPQGLLIQGVAPGSLLEKFGLQPGDVVRTVNGEVVTSEADVARILQSRGLQGPFTAEVQRGGVTMPISVNAQH